MHIGKERPATNIPTHTSQNKAEREHYQHQQSIPSSVMLQVLITILQQFYTRYKTLPLFKAETEHYKLQKYSSPSIQPAEIPVLSPIIFCTGISSGFVFRRYSVCILAGYPNTLTKDFYVMFPVSAGKRQDSILKYNQDCLLPNPFTHHSQQPFHLI